eukprot:14705184-Alexandrium_andersonii.AAC.1
MSASLVGSEMCIRDRLRPGLLDRTNAQRLRLRCASGQAGARGCPTRGPAAGPAGRRPRPLPALRAGRLIGPCA